MKRIALAAALLGSLSGFGQVYVREEAKESKQLDTIYVNNGTSYLIFNDNVMAYGLGDEVNYEARAYKNSLQVRRGLVTTPGMSTVFVRYGDSTYTQYYYAVVKYDASRINTFNDFRDALRREQTSKVAERALVSKEKEDQENLFISELKTRSGVIRNMQDEEFALGVTDNGQEVYLRLIRTDNNYAYLKFYLKNTSAVDYQFEKISFQYVQKYRMGWFKQKKVRYVDVFPIVVNGPEKIAAYSGDVLVYIIPTFGIKSNEKLLVTFREKDGGRYVAFEVENEVIMGAKVLEERRK